MKKLLTLGLMALSVTVMSGQDNLLIGKEIYPLGGAKTWTNANGDTYSFVESDLQKLIADPTNTDNVYLYPEEQSRFTDEESTSTGIQGFYIDLGSTQSVSTIVTTWEGATADEFNIYLMDTTPEVNSLPSPTLSVTGVGQVQSHTATLPDNSKGQYLVFEPTKALNYGWGVKIRSISAIGNFDEELTTFTVSPAIIEFGKATELTFSFANQLGMPIDANNVTVTSSSNAELNGTTLTINSGDSATLTATMGSDSIEAVVYAASSPSSPNASEIFVPIFTNSNTSANDTFITEVAWNGENGNPGAVNNGKIEFNDGKVAWSFGNVYCVFFANSETTGEWNGNIFPTESNYKSLELDIFASKNAQGRIDFEGSEVIPQNSPFTLEAGKWNHVSVNLVGETKLNNMSVRFAGENACDILLSNIYFTELKDEDQPVATTLNISVEPGALFFKESAEVTAIVLDQYGTEITDIETPSIEVTGANYLEGLLTAGETAGEATITATLGNLKAEKTVAIVDPSTYCMSGATVTSDTNAANPEYAIDGGAYDLENANNRYGNTFVVTENEAAGPAEHWILVKLARPYNLTAINALWEGACPRDYDVYVGETEDNLNKLYSVTGHTQQNWDDRFSGAEMNNVRYIKLVTTYNATGYGIKLHDIKAYGEQAVASVPTSVLILKDLNYIATDETVKLSAFVYDQFDGILEDQPVTYYVDGEELEGNEFQPSEVGHYFFTAKSGDIVSNEEELTVLAIAESRFTEPQYTATLDGEPLERNPFTQETQFEDVNMPLVINFDSPCEFGLIRLSWEAACPSAYTVTATLDNDSEIVLLDVKNRGMMMGVNPFDRIYSSDVTHETHYIGLNAQAGSAQMQNVTRLTINPTEKDHGYALRLLKLDVYGTEGGIVAGAEGLNVDSNEPVDVYNMNGILIRKGVAANEVVKNLPAGLYIIGGKKIIVK